MSDEPPIQSNIGSGDSPPDVVPPILTRPGPDAIGPRQAPGGLVLHVYAVPSERLLLTRPLRSIAEAEATAWDDAELVALLADPSDVCIVAYDGDTGERVRLRGGRVDDPGSMEPR